MYDGPDVSDDTLQRGLRYKGLRKPSQILDALQLDLQWVSEKLIEGGHPPLDAYRIMVEADAFAALCRSNPDYDVEIPDDFADEDFYTLDIQTQVVMDVVTDLIQLLDENTELYLIYGWGSDNPDDDGYDELGVWIDWRKIDKDLESGILFSLDYEADIDDTVIRDGIREAGHRHAIFDDGDRVAIYETTLGTLIWEN